MKGILYLVFVSLLISSCTGEKEKAIDVYAIRSAGQLATVEYTLGKVIETKEEDVWYKFGDRRMLISCRAKAKAGVDLTKIRPEDIQVSGRKVTILLPAAELFSLEMDPLSIRTEVKDVSGFRHNFSQAERLTILQKGEESIRKDLEKTKIIEKASKHARSFVKTYYQNLGFTDVDVQIQSKHEAILQNR